MRSVALAVMSTLLIATGVGTAAGRFDVTLPVDKQAVHVLNRLAFGPRPGDRRRAPHRRRRLDPSATQSGADAGKPLPRRQADTAGQRPPPHLGLFEQFQPPQPVIRSSRRTNLTQVLGPAALQQLLTARPRSVRCCMPPLTPEVRRQVLAAAPATRSTRCPSCSRRQNGRGRSSRKSAAAICRSNSASSVHRSTNC